MDYVQGGSFLDFTGTLEGALQLDFDTVIPGHGPLSKRPDMTEFASDVAAMRSACGARAFRRQQATSR